eukprot:6968974-Ditylum_brightwellii.AAC.1
MEQEEEEEGVVSTIDEDTDEEENIFMTKMRKKIKMMRQWRMRAYQVKITVSVCLGVLQHIVSRNYEQKESWSIH